MTIYAVHHWSFVRRWPIPGMIQFGLYVDKSTSGRVSQRWRDLVNHSNEIGLVALQFDAKSTFAANGLYPLLVPLHGKMTLNEKTATLRFEFGFPVLPLIQTRKRARGSWYVDAE